MDKERLQAAVREILLAVGEDPDRPGLVETPRRVADMYAEVFAGLETDPRQHLKFFEEKSTDEMVIVRDIPFASMCIIGLSKFARIVDCFARRPQVQERLTHDVADFLNEELRPKGVAVILEAEHMCMNMRGAKAAGSTTQTSALRGIMKTDARTRAEALALLTK